VTVQMPQFSEEELGVARHYNERGFDDELVRLPQECPVEMAITKRWLARVVKAGDKVCEIGVGGGHYSEFLARRGCRLLLVDVSARLLDAVTEKLRKGGLAGALAGCHHASGARLDGLQSKSLDLVLSMGPLYHLRSLDERRRSVQESARILKKGGTLFAAGINRLAYLRDLLRMNFAPASGRVAFHQQYLRDGNLDPEHAPPIGWAHLTTAAEFSPCSRRDLSGQRSLASSPSRRCTRRPSAASRRRKRSCGWTWLRRPVKPRRASASRTISFLSAGNRETAKHGPKDRVGL